MKKLDVFAWSEFEPGVQVPGSARNLEVRCSAPSALYVSCQGYEALAGVGTDFDVGISEPFSFRLEGPQGVRCFYKGDFTAAYQAEGQVHTNCDRLPHQSGAVMEVRRALREQQFRHQQFMREARAAAAEIRRAQADAVAALKPGEGIEKKPSPGVAAPDPEPGEKPGEGIQKKPSPGDAA